MAHTTPEEWQDLWRGPSEPLQYTASLVYKAKSIEELKHIATEKQFFCSPIKLSKLFRPIALLNALRQYTARKKKMSIDDLQMQNSWSSNILKADVVLTVTDIFIQGALFEREIIPTRSSSPAFSYAPNLFIAWMPFDAVSPYSLSESIMLPLYTNPDRRELVAELCVPCKNAAIWQTASVALFLASA
ncbi:unnamed protein product [Enterobius vermicularis]|uniref:Dynein_C domain-containing protein n=1 Tax=Enterobius vermicularis TaxID=51028 RepID=A0A0N4UTH1_ENTVE|nr:unnamed protein product [Enterobius vermicularis]